MTSYEAAEEVVARVEKTLGEIEVLVNSAGAARRYAPDETTRLATLKKYRDIEAQCFADNSQAAPGRLEEIEDRLAALDRLKRKYGQTLKEVIAFGAEAERQLAEVEKITAASNHPQ